MFAEEWPLMMFTLFAQLAIGSYLFIVIIRSLSNKVDSELAICVTKKGIVAIGPIMGIALLLSVFHLGTPLGAYRSILNIDSSWLSREIVFTGGFFFLWIVSFVLDRKGKWNNVVGWITSIVGLGAIYSMASIYATSIKPAWSDINTYFAFFGTTIVFGAAAIILIVLLSKEEKPESLMNVLKGIGIIGVAAILIQLIYLPVYTSGLLANGGEAGIASATILTENYSVASLFRWILTISGLALIGLALSSRIDVRNKAMLYTAALTFVFAGEFIGRYIFYGSGVPITIG